MNYAGGQMAEQPVIKDTPISVDKKSWKTNASRQYPEAKQPIMMDILAPTDRKSGITDARRQVARQPIRNRQRIEFLIDMPTVCSLQEWKSLVEVLIFITSSYEHVTKRQSLRKSWLLYSRNNTANMRYIFILGRSNNKTLSQNIMKENIEYRDCHE